MEKYEKDNAVTHPNHYCYGGIETIDFIRAKLTPEEFAGYCKGNALKYISRMGHKGNAEEDARKATVYLNCLVEQKQLSDNCNTKVTLSL